MCVSENKMTKLKVKTVLCVLLSLYACSAIADDTAKLNELQRAMSAPAVEMVKKPRTRSIVFDAKPEVQESVAAPVSGSVACNALPADVKSTAVDFTIEFKIGSAQIAPSSEKLLNEIAKILSLNKNCVIVEGHTDATGNAEKNNVLSRERADSVVEFISQKAGVDKNRLVPVGKGSSEPLQNLDPRNPHNRRVVFKVVG